MYPDKTLICVDCGRKFVWMAGEQEFYAEQGFFADICSLIGKVSNNEDSFTTMWIREKLYEFWGERTTLDVPVKNILRTMVEFEVLDKVKTGVYRIKQRPG